MTMQLAEKPQDLSISEMGTVFVKSGFFQDVRDQSQAIVKILAGQELGVSPIASMTGVYIVKGKPSMGANLIAACIKKSGRYNYKVRKLDDKECEIEFFERFEAGGKLESSGVSRFTFDDAKRALTQNIDKFPRNMLFARAMSNGAKWYCPSIFAGGVYTPDELGAKVEYDESGEIKNVIDAEIVDPKPEQPSTPLADAVKATADAIPVEKWPGDYGLQIITMPLEMALQEKDSHDKPYSEIDTETLLFAVKTMSDALHAGKTQKGAKLTEQDIDKYYRKIAAAKAIVLSRE